MLSLIIPVYKNEESLERLIAGLIQLEQRMTRPLEVVFVVDGSPDACDRILRQRLPGLPLCSQLLSLSRNFGSFAAITAGLTYARGEMFACLAADLQEPLELILDFERILGSGAADVVFGARVSRGDPLLSRLASGLFWSAYRRFINHDVPAGGVDVFGCTAQVRDELLRLNESNTNLMALLLWLGFRREFVPYERKPRLEGRSAWTLGKKLRYAINSIFNFTDLPIRVLLACGVVGIVASCLASTIVFWAWFLRDIKVPGYTPIVLGICFFGGLTALGLGIIGQYLWLALQNTRHRPNFVVANRVCQFSPSVKT
jgi:glycosyltransferase involved in cell wall biosynthesis